MQTTILTESDIRSLLEMRNIINSVEQIFKAKGLGKIQMPSKTYLYYEKSKGDLRIMPSYLEDMDVSAVKVVNSHPNNRSEGLPSVMGTIILIDPRTGFPLSIMGGTWLTAMRTGATSAISAKYLARKNSNVLGIIGTGLQATTQLMAMLEVLSKITEVRAYDSDNNRLTSFLKEAKNRYPEVRISGESKAEVVVRNSDICITLTPTRKPHIREEWVRPGTHFCAIGADAPGKQELDPNILKNGTIIVDDMEQAAHGGEINLPLKYGIITRDDVIGDLSSIVLGKVQGRTSEDEITIFDSTGLAMQDAVIAKHAYDQAVQMGLGQRLDLVL